MTSGSRLDDAAAQIFALQEAFDLPERVGQEAQQMLVQVYEQRDVGFEGVRINNVVAACVFVVARVHSEGLIPDEIADHAGTDRKRLLRRTKQIAADLDLDPSMIIDPEQYIDVICDELALDESVAEQAKLIVEHGNEEGITSGKNPRGVAAAAVYSATILLGVRMTQWELSNTIDVSEVTIRNRYQELLEADPPTLSEEGASTGKDQPDEDDADHAQSGISHQQLVPDDKTFVEPPEQVFDDALGLVGDDKTVKPCSQELFRLVQESPLCEFAMSDSIETWALAAVCVAAEQQGLSPEREEKEALADLGDVSAYELEARCVKIRRAWRQMS